MVEDQPFVVRTIGDFPPPPGLRMSHSVQYSKKCDVAQSKTLIFSQEVTLHRH
jgi:hypothetical protein